MKSFAVIGYPLQHTLSPALYQGLYTRLDLSASYHTLEIQPREIPDVVARLRNGQLDGINITMPYKRAFMDYLDEATPQASAIGAVNCVVSRERCLVGHNTDVDGIVQALEPGGVDPSGKRVLILGAGGAARAALYTMWKLGAGEICLAGRRPEATQSIIDEFENQMVGVSLNSTLPGTDLDTSKYQLIIHATPVGMWPDADAAILREDQLHPQQTVFDMVYRPERTRLLKLASERGCATVSGLDMFIGQGLAALFRWFPGLEKQIAGRTVLSDTLTEVKADLRRQMATDSQANT